MTEAPILLAGIAILAGITIVKWLVFTGLLWIAIKIQKMQYNVLGLFGSSLLATLIGFIPFVGNYLAWVVLVLCLWKVTREDIVPDCVLTVALANAVMFALNLFVIGALMGDLRPGFMAGERNPPSFEAAEDDLPDRDELEAPPAPPAQAMAKAAKPAVAAASRPKPAAQPASLAPAAKPPPHGLALKGLIMDPRAPSAMIAAGKDRFTIQAGESVQIPTAQGSVRVRCEEITQAFVRLSLNDSREVTLRVR